MFSKLSIRTKIIAVVSLLLLALAGMGLLSARSMRSLNANTHEIASNWLPSIKALGDLHADVVMYRAIVRQHMIADTKEDKDGAEKALAALSEKNAKIRKDYEAMITSPEERTLYADFSKRWEEYKAIAAKMIELSKKDGLSREARELNKDMMKAGNDADALLAKDIELN